MWVAPLWPLSGLRPGENLFLASEVSVSTLGVAARLGYEWLAGLLEVPGWSRRRRGAGPPSASGAKKAAMTMCGPVTNLGARRVVGVGGVVRGIVIPCCVCVGPSVVVGLVAVVVVDNWWGSGVHGVGALL